jgi:predicted RNA-binding Zn-ribbon protein involved in translation (DUF1610 family)
MAIGGELPADGPEWIACGCGAGVAVRSLPRQLVARAEAFFTHLIGEDPALVGVTAPSRVDGRTEDVLFPCPHCGDSIPVNAASNRIVKCHACSTSAYLPDDLWKHLHPIRVAERWYAWVDEARLQRYWTRRSTLDRAGTWSAVAGLFSLVLFGGLILFGVDEDEVSRETAMLVTGFGYAGLVLAALIGQLVRRSVQEAAERRASVKTLAIILGLVTAGTARIVILNNPRRQLLERARWQAAAIRCCESYARSRDVCATTVNGAKSVREAHGLYDFYKGMAAKAERTCEP